MEIIWTVVLGYLLGCLSPAAFFSRVTNHDLKSEGTGNLGASNTFLVLGKGYGVLVMVFDVAKSFIAVKLAKLLFPRFVLAGLVAGGACIAGHNYPFYLKFRGGKGLAAFGGLILAVDPLLCMVLFVVAISCMFLFNHTVAAPLSGAILFPVLYGFRSFDMAEMAVLIIISLLIVVAHIPNVQRVRRGDDVKMREYVKEHLSK